MKTLLRLAWRNVWRHRRRTILLVLVVAYAAFATIFYWGFLDGFTDSVITAQARFVGAPVLVTTTAYHEDPDPENALADLSFLTSLQRDRRVRAAAPRLEFAALIRSAYTTESVVVRGVDPDREAAVSVVPSHLAEGRWLRGPGELVLGRDLALRIDVRVGERAVVDTAGKAGPQAAGLVLVGVVSTGAPGVDDRAVIIHIDDARGLTGAGATSVALDVPRGQEDRVAAALRPLLPPGVASYGPMEMLGAIRKDIEGNRYASIPIILLFALVAAAAVTSTSLVSVIERTRELGMISALGLAPARLARVIILESVITSLIGWALGLAAGYGTLAVLARVNVLGKAFGSTYSRAFSALPLTEEMYAAVHPVYALYASVTVVVAALLALLIPARRVRRLAPAQAMRME